MPDFAKIMAHFYKYNAGNPIFLEDAKTPTQAKKIRGAMPSVTTVLSIMKDPFLDDIYKPREMTKIAREKPNLHWKDVKDLTYGLREHPFTGDMIPSSEFGTAVHKRIEEYVNADINESKIESRGAWDDWAEPFILWCREQGVTLIASEHMIGNDKLRLVGSVDFIGKDASGEVFLADYKCRSNCKGKAKVYDKDLYQLAIESWMLQQKTKLKYIPGCVSVCIDIETCEHYHHVWSEDQILHGIKVAKLCAELYNKTRMK